MGHHEVDYQSLGPGIPGANYYKKTGHMLSILYNVLSKMKWPLCFPSSGRHL